MKNINMSRNVQNKELDVNLNVFFN
ncbi:hypothetical protein CMALT430_160165 [Carnobacterium maltaromaticum]|nr:hypothetical protein CMALT430_160165 [Carnobacterium maltaromaticum]